MAIATASLRLRSILKTAARRAGLGQPASILAGLTPAARALHLAALTARPVIVVVPADRDVEAMVTDVGFFLGCLDGLTTADVARAVRAFPSHEVDPYRGLAPHFDVAAARARGLHGLATGEARIVVASVTALFPRLGPPRHLLDTSVTLAPGGEMSPVRLGDLLAEGGFRREDPVDEHGEFCVRGGVVDVFPAGDERPIRLEFVGDTVESIRRYDPSTQRSVETLDRASLVPLQELPDDGVPATAWLVDYVPGGHPTLIVSERVEVRRIGRAYADQLASSHAEAVRRGRDVPEPSSLCVEWSTIEEAIAGASRLESLDVEEGDGPEGPGGPNGPDGRDGSEPSDAPGTAAGAGRRRVPCQPALEFHGRVADWLAEVRQRRDAGDTVVLVAATTGRAERCLELLTDHGLPAAGPEEEAGLASGVVVAIGRLTRGFRLPTAGLQIYGETDVFEEARGAGARRRAAAGAFLSDFRDLKAGDLVVHVDHGIGRFVGLSRIEVGQDPHEFMELRYANDNKLFVPVERLDLIQKYSGGARPPLDQLGGTTWERAKTRVRKAMRDMAEELLKLYAQRKAIPGHAFGPDSHWQQEFEAAFDYELTPDQATAIADIRRDMEAATPMDRLLCGDVGYGKTEVAMRAAFKAVMDGKQVAFLAPTTVLAFQHLKTLTQRFAAFPVRIAMISRFRSRAEQRAILEDLAGGAVDVIVGTHRLLSKDVEFRDLGLLVVDEEQRFGVAHKERIKQLRKRVDVLTMTATPIPRTLNMSLVGIRDMSVIETPPKDRQSIQTQVVKFDTAVVSRAIRNEIERGGQVYFVHNRVHSIYSVADLVRRLVPDARIAVAHGQLGEVELEKVMVDFVDRQHDVLVATTIIENGLDIPNANTMIVNRADRYGLAQLYQLRGRVGRSDRRAYAYLLIPPEDSLTPVARKRLAAIREFSDLGSGFRIAALDLEIRGAGNLLGGEQSGHIEAIGFEMYMKLLDQTIRDLRGEEAVDEQRAEVNLQVDLRIDEAFVPDMTQRLSVYRRIADARDADQVEAVLAEVRDRYGPVPPSVLHLAEYGRVRAVADRLGIERIERRGPDVVVTFGARTRVDPGALTALVQRRDDLALSPPAMLTLRLRPDGDGSPRRPRPAGPATERLGSRRTAAGTAGSWWTARARAGSVAPGFDKDSMSRRPRSDPRSPGGLFERVRELLDELSRAANLS